MIDRCESDDFNFLTKHLIMKTLKCDLCEATADGESFEAWMMALMPHYMQVHADVMKDPKNGEEEQMKWIVENKKRFETT